MRGSALALSCLLLPGCLFRGGRADAPVAVETVETTRRRADSLYDVALDRFRHGKWSEVVTLLDRALLIMEYNNPRRAVGYFMLAEAQFAQGNSLEAVRQFRRVADENASDSLAADALYRAGDAYAALWRRPELDPSYGESALLTYREVSERYPGSLAARRAQQQILDLMEQFAVKEFRTGLFYFRYKAYESAILVFRNLIASYPRTSVVPEALTRLVEAYERLDYQEDLRETCRYIEQFFPQVTAAVAERCPAPAANPPGPR